MATHARKPRAPRRHWPVSEKRRLVELTLDAGRSTRAIAREHDVHPTSLHHWKTLYFGGKLEVQAATRTRTTSGKATFIPVRVPSPVRTLRPAPDRDAWPSSGGIVRVTFCCGTALQIESGALDSALICALVAELRR